MTVVTINAVGFCAHYSQEGDWAFDFALQLSRRREAPLHVFHFLSDPYNPDDNSVERMSPEERAKEAIAREKELRLYYDQRAGDYLKVGFRLCEDREWTELHRCLVIREFQVLVLGYVGPSAVFAGRPIEEFAHSFVSPVVLVGPSGVNELRLNSRAALIADKLGIPEGTWTLIEHQSASS
jgi:hypothetical protein